MASFEYRAYRPGFMELARSSGVTRELKSVAQSMADKATADAQRHGSELHSGTVEKTPYAAAARQIDRTSLGVAYASTKIGLLMERRHKSLSRQNH